MTGFPAPRAAMPNTALTIVPAIVLLLVLTATPGFSETTNPEVRPLARGFVSAEGPVWHPGGYLLFSDVHGGKIYRLNPDGTSEPWFDKGKKTNGLVLSADGKKLFACCYSERELLQIDPATREFTVLARECGGRPFNNVNDIALDSEGNVFFTDPKWGARPGDVQGVYCRHADGSTTLAASIDRQPNGIVISSDDQWVFVSRSGARDVLRFRRLPGGRLVDESVWVKVESEPDGMAMDRRGNLYVALAGNGKVCVVSPEGKVSRTIPVVDKMATNCAFNPADDSVLYVTGKEAEGERPGAVYEVRLRE